VLDGPTEVSTSDLYNLNMLSFTFTTLSFAISLPAPYKSADDYSIYSKLYIGSNITPK